MGNLGTSRQPGVQPATKSSRSRLLSFRAWLEPQLQAVSGIFGPCRVKPDPMTTAKTDPSVASHLLEPAANSQQFTLIRPATDVTPLRVVRVVDASCSSHSAGRMVISGRFSDVCAELDRLSQQVAA